MSILKTDGIGVYEREIEQNWAAAYAKRLIDALTAVVTANKTDADNTLSVLNTLTAKVKDGSAIGSRAITLDKLHTDAYPRFDISDSGDLTVFPIGALTGSIEEGISTFFDSPLKDTYARDEITGLQTALAKHQSYSTTPQQIGTWIDGTPMWRVAFNKAALDEVSKLDRFFDTFRKLSIVADIDEIRLVTGGFACIDNGSVIDNITTVLNALGYFEWDFECQDDYITGYIEFVTPASNILTS